MLLMLRPGPRKLSEWAGIAWTRWTIVLEAVRGDPGAASAWRRNVRSGAANRAQTCEHCGRNDFCRPTEDDGGAETTNQQKSIPRWRRA